MEGKRKSRGWRRVAVTGCAVVAVLAVLMVIGLTLGTRKAAKPPGAVITSESKNGAADEPETGFSVVRDKSVEPLTVTPGAEEQATGKNAGSTGGTIPPLDDKVIRTGSLSIEIKKDTLQSAYGRVVAIAEGVGGFVSDSRTDSSAGRMTGGTITIRVPNDSFSKVMVDLEGIGKVTSLSQGAEDVTDEYVDLESRIRNLEAQESVYLGLMAKAQTIEESIAVQRELSAVQQQIEQLKGRKNFLDNHIGFSAVQVSLREPGVVAAGGESWGFVQALKDAAHGIVNGFNVVVRFCGNALVYVMIAGALASIGFVLWRRRSGAKPAEA